MPSYVQGANVDIATLYAVDVSVGAVAAPAPGTVDSFTGADGAGWSATNWVTTAYSAGSSLTLSGNQGRLAVGVSGGYSDKAIAVSTLAARADGGIGVTIVPVDVSKEWYFQIALRAQTVDASVADQGALRVEIGNSGYCELTHRAGGTSTSLGATGSIAGWGSGVPVRVEVYASGSSVAVRAWTGSTRPATATVQGTDANPYPAGATALILNGGNAAAVTSVVLVDDWTTSVQLS